MPHRYRGAPLKLSCLVGDCYLVLRLGELNELVTVAKSRLHKLRGRCFARRTLSRCRRPLPRLSKRLEKRQQRLFIRRRKLREAPGHFFSFSLVTANGIAELD